MAITLLSQYKRPSRHESDKKFWNRTGQYQTHTSWYSLHIHVFPCI